MEESRYKMLAHCWVITSTEMKSRNIPFSFPGMVNHQLSNDLPVLAGHFNLCAGNVKIRIEASVNCSQSQPLSLYLMSCPVFLSEIYFLSSVMKCCDKHFDFVK